MTVCLLAAAVLVVADALNDFALLRKWPLSASDPIPPPPPLLPFVFHREVIHFPRCLAMIAVTGRSVGYCSHGLQLLQT